ncbi:MAG: hypothetical protein A3G95_05765 [Flavobacteria bacterium RIFCSPLOWO2_12_FULL_31_7]|nr:MAG: hypothetical protein A3G95_05765 [Flavobacteria bacterium RIFCSPLOWO2_12_FULL_31_7]
MFFVCLPIGVKLATNVPPACCRWGIVPQKYQFKIKFTNTKPTLNLALKPHLLQTAVNCWLIYFFIILI